LSTRDRSIRSGSLAGRSLASAFRCAAPAAFRTFAPNPYVTSPENNTPSVLANITLRAGVKDYLTSV
jgi:hypothetical protein